MVTGKGGVGKTTVAVGLAAAAAETSGGAVVIEFGDGESGRRLLQRHRPANGARIEHVVIAPQDAVARSAVPLFGSAILAKAVLGNFAFKRFLRTTPAIRELAMLECVRVVATEHPGKRVVVDMPATGHGIAWLRVADQLRGFTGSGPLFELTDRVCKELLAPGRSSIVVVTLPERLVLHETMELCAAMQKEVSVRPSRLVVNRFPVALPAQALEDARAMVAGGRVPSAAPLLAVIEARNAALAEADASLRDVLHAAHIAPVVLPSAAVDPTTAEVVRWMRAEGAA
jgi:anion-transporting  ArsA/GET3 family ATPase